ncbi:TIR domain-containing protein [Acetobacter persici]|uniref:TIR domain-containing protein n=1 Tax=Acetobacter persici TaxID=1076596 RepID=A0A6V8I9Z7_9PROT|nr:TIR domain-containing protein [Acetobacter persici]GFE94400.1 hypothetical protein DmAi_24590 [Acetobacter persici]
MQVFLSWSGPRSQKVAQLLSDWLPKVIQTLEPWISTRDIQKGSLWSEVIGDQLQGMTTGIICLTKENINRPWILFEAGALAKGLSSNRVCTLLIDLEPSDIAPPLSQFNHTRPSSKEDMLHFLQTLNDRVTGRKLRSDILENALDVHWTCFQDALQKIIKETPDTEKIPDRPKDDIMKEILENTRSLVGRMNRLENTIPRTDKHLKISNKNNLDEKIILNRARSLRDDGNEIQDCHSILCDMYPKVHNDYLVKLICDVFNEAQ